MQESSSTVEYNPQEIAEKIRTGEFFREAENSYHYLYNDPMSERYLFLIITILAILIFVLTVTALNLLYPLRTEVPFIFESGNIADEYPIIKPIEGPPEPNIRLRYYLVGNFIKLHQSYNIDLLERNANGVRSQSTEEVFNTYQRLMDPSNPLSPIALYQRNAVRSVEILNYVMVGGDPNHMEVYYNMVVDAPDGRKKTPMRANITFRFDDIQVDQDSGGTTPLTFVVTSFETTRAQES